MALQARLAQASSLLLRLLSYFFLRWALVPVLPPIIYTLFAVNVPAVFLSHLFAPKYEVVAENVDVVVTETLVDLDGDGEADVQEEDVEVTDTVLLAETPAAPWHTLVLGTPSRSRVLSLLTVLLNLALVAMVVDRVYSEHRITADDLSFVRLGYVSDREARFLLREPDQAQMPVRLEYRLKDPLAPYESPLWEAGGGMRWTDNRTDYTVALTVLVRNPGVRRTYVWRTSNNHTGEFTLAPKPGQTKTAAAAAAGQGDPFNGTFTFVATSCMLSRVPYNPLDHPLAIPGVRHLAKVLPTLGAQFVLFLGDFIYADVPRWWGTSVDDYRQKYRQVYASPDWNAVAQNTSWLHVLDDHEIANDWSANNTGIYSAAIDPWYHYHMAANPPAARRADAAGHAQAARDNATYFSFVQGPASFFLLDTRSYRSSNSLPYDSTDKSMLGADQLADFLAYLRRPEPRGVQWKIVASSVPFTKNWRVNTRDTWGGFLTERQVILEAMWDAALRGTTVVVLSGDRHEFAATKFPPPAAAPRTSDDSTSSSSSTSSSGNDNITASDPDAADPVDVAADSTPDAAAIPEPKWPQSAAAYEFSASPLNQFYSPVPTYFQWDDEDVKIRYINKGNSKFGVVTIRPSDEQGQADKSLFEYRLFVDGAQVWNTTLVSPDAVIQPSLWERLRWF